MAKKEKTELNIKDQLRADGYVDVAKKIGTGKTGNTGFNLKLANDSLFAAIYVGNGLAKRYIDLLVDDMTRQWIDIPEDTDGKMLKYMSKLKTKGCFKQALRKAKLFGGSIIFMVIEDGGLPNEPVNVNNIKSIKKLRTYSRKYVTIDEANYYSDPSQANFGDPQYFNINTNGRIMSVHESRCLVFQGEYYPCEELGMQPDYGRYWGMSILQAHWESFENYGLALEALFKLLIKANVDVLKIKNLFKLLSTADGRKQLDARATTFDLAKSVSTTLVLDADESYESIAQALQGVAETFSKLESAIAGQTGIPGNIFFGTPTKGLNATGDNEQRTYYDKIKSDQEEEELEPLNKFTGYIAKAKDYKGAKPAEGEDGFEIKFNKLWQQTEAEDVDMRYKQAQTDEIYANLGVIDPNEIRKSRFSGTYSIETEVDGDEAPGLPEPEIKTTNVQPAPKTASSNSK